MTNVVRANRTIEDRARFGLGSETQDDDTAPSTDETVLSAEGVVEDSSIGVPAANVVVADDDSFYGADPTTAEALFAQIFSYFPLVDVTTAAITIDSDSSAGGNGAGATPGATGLLVFPAASATYLVDIEAVVTSTTNGGIELSFTVPAGATFTWSGQVFDSSGAGVFFVGGSAASALNHIATALVTDPIRIKGVLTMSTTTSGGFAVLAAQDTGHADNTVVHVGSSLRLTRAL